MELKKLIVGIDASRNRSGGAVAHMIGLIGAATPERYGIEQVHVWSYDKLLRALPARPWLVRHNPSELELGILSQLYWQRYRFPSALERAGCGIVFNTDAGSIGRFKPSVTLSQDLLSYEAGEMKRGRWSKARLRLWLLWHIQNRSLRHADGAIFLTQYTSDVIQRATGALPNVAIIPHGVHESFRGNALSQNWPEAGERQIRCIYVSNALPYKHQWHVVRAISLLRSEGYPLTLTLVGGGHGPAQERLNAAIKACDPFGVFVTQHAFVANEALPRFLSDADLFIFASSCETFGITLLEGMTAGLPIACSNRSGLPELLGDGGIYFDPEAPTSIAAAIRKLVDDPDLRRRCSENSQRNSANYSWQRCANETFEFLARAYQKKIQ